ncbi:MAG: hypothetical protein Q4A28_00170 [Brachymonas sp.]|nr:hypothetical protein [Brachymonas sp.]
MRHLILSAVVLMLVACGKTGSKAYLGYWQEQDSERVAVMEIKQKEGNYFFEHDIVSDDGKPYVLSEKDGQLGIDTGLGVMSFKLSEDGNSLFFEDRSYRKIDETTKNQLLAQQESCRKLSEEYAASHKNLPPLFPSGPYDKAKTELVQRFSEQFAILEKNGKCNSKPFGLR